MVRIESGCPTDHFGPGPRSWDGFLIGFSSWNVTMVGGYIHHVSIVAILAQVVMVVTTTIFVEFFGWRPDADGIRVPIGATRPKKKEHPEATPKTRDSF